MKYKIAICVPSNGTWHADFGLSLAALCTRFNSMKLAGATSQKLVLFSTLGSMLSQSRETLAGQALAKGCTHILWLDSDMRFPWDTIHRLAAYKEDFVAANCTTKKIPAQPVAQDLDGSILHTDPGSEGLKEVKHVGLAVCLMKTKIITRIDHPWFPMKWLPSANSYTGEDVAFCHALKAEGVKLYIDHTISKQISHIGNFAYNHDVVGDIGNDRSSAA